MCQLLVAIDDGEDTRRKTAFRSLHSVNMHATALGSLTNGISGAKSSVDIAVVLAATRARSFLTAGAFKQLLLGGLACASSHCFAQSIRMLHCIPMEGQELHRYHAQCLKQLKQTSTHAYSLSKPHLPTNPPFVAAYACRALVWSSTAFPAAHPTGELHHWVGVTWAADTPLSQK